MSKYIYVKIYCTYMVIIRDFVGVYMQNEYNKLGKSKVGVGIWMLIRIWVELNMEGL